MIESTTKSTSKSRFKTFPNPGFTAWDSNPLQSTNGPDGYINEFISQDVGRKVFYKNCYHMKEKVSTSMPTKRNAVFPGYNGQNYNLLYNPCHHNWHPIYGMPNLPAQSFTQGSTLPSSDIPSSIIDDLSVEALKYMQPRIEDISDGFNVANFLAELRDIKSMFVLWKSSDTVLKNISSGVLNWELAWKPFIGDCEKIISHIASLQSYIDKWNADALQGVVYTRHCNMTKRLSELYTPNLQPLDRVWVKSSEDGPHQFSGGSLKHMHYRRHVRDVKVECFFHLYFKPQFIAYEDFLNSISIWFDLLGGGDGFSIVWEAIPFSFVIDWFLGVGDFLEQFELDAFDVNFELVDFGYSTKEQVKESFSHRSDLGSYEGRVHPYCGDYIYERSLYIRRRIHAPIHRLDEWSFDPLLKVSAPSWRQAWVGLNLANVLRK